jgi:ATP-dependent exoDNAse (exonuclease V) beta subunit
MDDARAATKIFREVPVAGNAEAGRAQGKADLLFERDGKWRVVEFKTDRAEGAEALQEHAAQLAGYSASLAAVVGAQVKGTICLVRQGHLVDLPLKA